MAYGVLIIEDEVVLAKNIRLYLERSGFEARTAESAEDGMQQIREFRHFEGVGGVQCGD